MKHRLLFVRVVMPALLSLGALPAFSQGQSSSLSPQEIVRRMSVQLDRASAEGFEAELNMKFPIVGEVRSHILSRGEKSRMEIAMDDKRSISWTDATAKREYDPATGVITVTSPEPQSQNEETDLSKFQDLAEGYKLSLVGETPQAWKILCKRLGSNPDKDAARKIDLTVSKDTFLPIYIGMKSALMKMSIENVSVGIPESRVTFDPAEFPAASIVDEREEVPGL